MYSALLMGPYCNAHIPKPVAQTLHLRLQNMTDFLFKPIFTAESDAKCKLLL